MKLTTQEEFERFMEACLNGIVIIFKLLEIAGLADEGLGDCMKQGIENYVFKNKPMEETMNEWIKSRE